MKTTRRKFLAGAAVASLPVTAGASAAATAIQAEAATSAPIAENPELLAAYARLQDAQFELREAKDSLEWIADEWRHLWPLAPEELLGPADADRHMGHAVGETDIIGNFILRDCSTLTKRLSPQFRKVDRRDCRAYENETARLRKAAGVEAAKRRIEDAKEEFFAACSDVSKIPAFGPEGLLIKAEAINATGYMDGFKRSEGIVGEMARFIQQVIDMGGRASA